MADKKLLEESTIRRFMKLANIPTISSDLLAEGSKPAKGGKKLSGGVPEEDEKRFAGKRGVAGLRETDGAELEEEQVEEGYEEEVAMHEAEDDSGEAEMPVPDMDAGMGDESGLGDELGGEEGGDIEADVQEIAARLSSILSKMGSNKEVAVEKEPEAGGEEGAGMEDVGDEDEAPMEEENALYEELEVEDDEALAEELTRRVAARLVAEMKKAKGKKKEDDKKEKVEEGKTSPGKAKKSGSAAGWLAKPSSAGKRVGRGGKKMSAGQKKFPAKGHAGK